jgi:hypothetical protein
MQLGTANGYGYGRCSCSSSIVVAVQVFDRVAGMRSELAGSRARGLLWL